MSSKGPREYFRRHSALSDWLSIASPESRNAILAEDLTRSHRLQILHDTINLPILGAVHFTGAEVAERSSRYTEFLQSAAGPYAIRAVKRNDTEIVYRNRNLPVAQLVEWVLSQTEQIRDFDLEFSRHLTNEWATIFVVAPDGVVGEFVKGSLRQLTQGEHTSAPPATYTYDFHEWTFGDNFEYFRELAKRAISCITVPDPVVRAQLRDALGCEFTDSGHICGYFEVIYGAKDDMRFHDFNIAMASGFTKGHLEIIRKQQSPRSSAIRGLTASRGRATGVAKLVLFDDFDDVEFSGGEIVVCVDPTPELIPLLTRAAALVSDRGGLLTHASVVCRELGIPCIVGAANATESIPDSATIEVDADRGVVSVISQPG